MADFVEYTLDECAEVILAINNPLVVMHVRPDGDTVGTASALCRIFRMLGKEPLYACEDSVPKRLKFLLTDFRRATEAEYQSRTVVSVDVPSAYQMGELFSKIPAPTLMIDHHEIGVPFAPNFIIKGESSAAEVMMRIAEKLHSMGKIEFTKELAYSLYAGISSDTGSFRYSNTTPDTLRRAARLMEFGIDFTDINHKLFSSKSQAQLKAEGYVSSRLCTACGGKVSYASIPRDERVAMGIPFEDLETSIDIVRAVMGAEIAFVIKETDKGEFKASIRSTGADVARVAAEFGGGGHIRASGCTVPARSAEEAAELVLEKLEGLV